MRRNRFRALQSIPVFQWYPRRPPARFPQLQQAAIDDNPADPRFKRRLAAKIFQPPESEEIGNLHGILSIF
jgi:hypothetical protein